MFVTSKEGRKFFANFTDRLNGLSDWLAGHSQRIDALEEVSYRQHRRWALNTEERLDRTKARIEELEAVQAALLNRLELKVTNVEAHVELVEKED